MSGCRKNILQHAQGIATSSKHAQPLLRPPPEIISSNVSGVYYCAVSAAQRNLVCKAANSTTSSLRGNLLAGRFPRRHKPAHRLCSSPSTKHKRRTSRRRPKGSTPVNECTAFSRTMYRIDRTPAVPLMRLFSENEKIRH